MITKLRLLYACCLLAMLLVPGTAYSQLNFSEDFEAEENEWTADSFIVTDEEPCGGSGSFRANAMSFFGFTIPVETISPSIGTSNGQPATLSFSYKLVNYAADPPFDPLMNDPEWGVFTIEYATSADGPWTEIDAITPATHTESDGCAVFTSSFTPPPGVQVYLRFFLDPDAANDLDAFVYLDDMTVTQAAGAACTGAPAVAATTASATSVCINQEVVLSLNPYYTESGLSFQWQSSADGVNFSNIAGSPDSPQYTVVQPATTWYRALVTCSAGGGPVPSTAVQVVSNGEFCYCEVEFETDVEPITHVNFAGIDNTTSEVVDDTPAVEDFTTTVPAGNVVQGGTYTIALQGNTGGSWTNYFTVFIDFNQDGEFAGEDERFDIGTIYQSTGTDGDELTGEIAIPADALPGTTRMRVFKLFGGYPEVACGEGDTFGYGQAEDYLLTIAAPSGCTTAPAAATIVAEDTTLCATQQSELSLSLDYNETGISYQWQSSADGVDFEDITGAEADTYTITNQAQTTWYRAVVICENGNLTTPTAPVQILTTTPVCYCEVEYGSGIEPITSVTFGTLTNTTPADPEASGAMEDFTAIDPPVVEQGSTYTITLAGNTAGDFANYFTVFFDWNHDGDLEDAGEMYEVGSVDNTTGEDGVTIEGNIQIPETALLGNTYMRVMKLYNVSPTNPCGDEYGYGQVENYLVYVDAAAGTASFNNASLRYHPNPVKDVFNVSYSSAISSVEVYNLVGQQVLAKDINSTNAQVDMSSISAGAYIIKINAENGSTTIKVIKQ